MPKKSSSSLQNALNFITVLNAREKNLKNISLQIPKNKLIVLTGPSGSGKSTLAFGTLYAEGRRRYIESLSSYARQFLGTTEKPDVDQISGLTPAIAIEQKTISKNPRSTVGTVTEIYDYLRLLYSRIGIAHCINEHGAIQAMSLTQIVKRVQQRFPKRIKLTVYAPAVSQQKGQFQTLFRKWVQEGFDQVWVDGKVRTLDEEIRLTKTEKHTISLLIDEFSFDNSHTSLERLNAALETALKYGNGFVDFFFPLNGQINKLSYSQNYTCLACDYTVPEMEPRFFSFNAASGACESCKGLGTTLEVDQTILIPNDALSINEGGILFYRSVIGTESLDWKKLVALCDHFKIDRDLPLRALNSDQLDLLFYGSKVPIKYWLVNQKTGSRLRFNHVIDGVINIIKRRFLTTSSRSIHSKMTEKYLIEQTCLACRGKRLNPAALAVYIAGLNIADFCRLSIKAGYQWLQSLKLSAEERQIVAIALREITNRLQFLNNIGLNYLTLARSADTLSGGESQRIRLATQIGSQLTGVLYVLDEPSIGLHQYDNHKLITTLRSISELGNTVLVVEHDLEMMHAADYLIDLGPHAGKYGGELVAAGSPEIIMKNPASITGQFLSGQKTLPVPKTRRALGIEQLQLFKANANNLHDFSVTIPLHCLVCLTGLSGSGKSTLINDVLYKNLKKQLHRFSTVQAAPIEALLHHDRLEKVVYISQEPIGRTPRSNPATYTDVFTDIRNLFAQTPLAKTRGYKPGRFSFNIHGGRCEKCNGDGHIAHSMLFLPDVYITCSECQGKRYNAATLEIKYKGKTIADVLKMEIQTATHFFAHQIVIQRKLQTLVDVGLGYLQLGQSSTELSGGEAQRVKLAAHLNKRTNHSDTLYLFDEPTTGLHSCNVETLMKMINGLVDQGGSVIIIEHNLDVIKMADYIIDLGPKGGEEGGKVVATGTPEEVAQNRHSYTGKFLRKIL